MYDNQLSHVYTVPAFVFSLCIALMQASHSLQSAAMSSAVLAGQIWADNSYAPQCSSPVFQGRCLSGQIQLTTAFLASAPVLSCTLTHGGERQRSPADLCSEWVRGRKLERRQRKSFLEGILWKTSLKLHECVHTDWAVFKHTIDF